MTEVKKIILTPDIIKNCIPKNVKIIEDKIYQHRILYLYDPLKLYSPNSERDIYTVCSDFSYLYIRTRWGYILIKNIKEHLLLGENNCWSIRYIKEYESQNMEVPELLN